MMYNIHLKKNNKIQISLDSPSASGAGTQAKLLAKHYNLLYLDTGKIISCSCKSIFR